MTDEKKNGRRCRIKIPRGAFAFYDSAGKLTQVVGGPWFGSSPQTLVLCLCDECHRAECDDWAMDLRHIPRGEARDLARALWAEHEAKR